MKCKILYRLLLAGLFFTGISLRSNAHDIYFCGEKIPLSDKLIAEKMMNIIKRQMNYVNIPSLRQKINEYMPRVVEYLTAANLPLDFKYLAIVESGFKNEAASPVGAVGFWQLMPETARQWDLVVNETIDERTDFTKCTIAAFQLIASYYLKIRRTYGISSWVLTAAAYNVGIGRIGNAISKQGNDYFTMNLNPETSEYVYKIIAIKELFEYPELYMKNFGYNVFNTTTPTPSTGKDTDVSAFRSMKVDINEADGLHPNELSKGNLKEPVIDPSKLRDVEATIKGKYKHVKDGDLINMELKANLEVGTRFTAKGVLIQGTAWIIDDRVMVDLGYEHRVTLYDTKDKKGIALSKLKKNPKVILKVLIE